MKTRIPTKVNRGRQHQAGMATIVVIMILSILLIFAMGNAKTLNFLGRNLKVVEQQQKHRIAAQVAPSAKTNLNAAVQSAPPSP